MNDILLNKALRLRDQIAEVDRVLSRFDQDWEKVEDVPTWIIKELYMEICELKDKKQKEYEEL